MGERDRTPLDRTADDVRGTRRGGAGERTWVTLALEAGRAASAPLQLPLIPGTELAIGRGAEREVIDTRVSRLLKVPDPWMSAEHARVRLGHDGARVADVGSRNGTFVNGRRVEEEWLSDGDVLELGHTLFVLRSSRLIPDADASGLDALPTFHPALRWELSRLRRIAASSVSVLLLGETGTGKELAAREVHRLSERPGAFVPVNCAGIPLSLIESELFGHKKGAFSGATEDQPGLVRAADRGTLFLDEVGDLPLPSQAALLRTLQDGEVRAVGATKPVRVDVRVIAATHRDLDAMTQDGAFRSDLLARLSGFRARLPPLRERREDIGALVSVLLRRFAGDRAASVRFDADAARALLLHDWPQNVRELEKCLASALVLAAGEEICAPHLPRQVTAALDVRSNGAAASEHAREEDVRRRAELETVLREHGGNVTKAARALGTARTQLQRWLKRHGIDPRNFRR